MRTTSSPASARAGQVKQRGVVLIFAMIALIILLVGAVAMVRSISTSLFTAGNYGFKRDLANQGERTMSTVVALFSTGALNTAAAREASAVANNYSAVILNSNARGIPETLLATDALFAGNTANDISVPNQGVTIRYVIDRLCTSAGSVDSARCALGTVGEAAGVNSQDLAVGTSGGVSVAGKKSASPIRPVYRVSMRVIGPRRTEAYFQTNFTVK